MSRRCMAFLSSLPNIVLETILQGVDQCTKMKPADHKGTLWVAALEVEGYVEDIGIRWYADDYTGRLPEFTWVFPKGLGALCIIGQDGEIMTHELPIKFNTLLMCLTPANYTAEALSDNSWLGNWRCPETSTATYLSRGCSVTPLFLPDMAKLSFKMVIRLSQSSISGGHAGEALSEDSLEGDVDEGTGVLWEPGLGSFQNREVQRPEGINTLAVFTARWGEPQTELVAVKCNITSSVRLQDGEFVFGFCLRASDRAAARLDGILARARSHMQPRPADQGGCGEGGQGAPVN